MWWSRTLVIAIQSGMTDFHPNMDRDAFLVLFDLVSCRIILKCVAPNFKDKTRYTAYVSLGSQISHIATNKGNINRQ